ncbi:MAG: iron ABC transporter permease [Clostridium sp.]|nr:iron ABC transporter permease [Clostridium sp.]MCM1547007.1 iron ABC transporter permease [Ruminococcus sp.]
MNKNIRYTACFIILFVLLAAAVMIGLYSGSIKIPAGEVTKVIFGKSENNSAENIIMEIRVPRVLSAVILGGALSVSGFLLQTFFANPIAGPFVLGISSGAKLAVAVTMIFSLKIGSILSSAELISSAFIGSILSMAVILMVSGKVKKSSALIVSGVMIGYICSAVTDFIVTFADDSNIVNLHNWSMGSFSGIGSDDIGVMAAVVFPAFAIVLLISKQIGAYQLGEVYAKNLGVNIKRFRAVLILLSSVLSACVTAFAGPVSFVGIAVPHIVKKIFGTAKPYIVVPASFLGGAVFCLVCDMIARTVFAPSELSISTVTALFGAPVVISIMLSRKKTA